MKQEKLAVFIRAISYVTPTAVAAAEFGTAIDTVGFKWQRIVNYNTTFLV